MYKMILENILHNVRFTPRFFRGNLHLVQEKCPLQYCPLYDLSALQRFFSENLTVNHSVPSDRVRFMSCPFQTDFTVFPLIFRLVAVPRCKALICNLRAQKTFKISKFYFTEILAGIVEKQHALAPFNFFFQFSHCLTLFPIFSVHVN